MPVQIDPITLRKLALVKQLYQHAIVQSEWGRNTISRTYTRDFLRKIIADVWEQNFEKISPTNMIQHAKVKEFISDAEIALNQNDHQRAVQKAAAGLTWALEQVEIAVVGRKQSFPRGIMLTICSINR